MADADALFDVDGDRAWPSELSRGPWSADALHGGPVAALIARAVEAVPSEHPMFVARLTIELMRPVPLAELVLTTSVLRPGRKVQLIETRVEWEGVDVARAIALQIRRAPHPEVQTSDAAPAWPGPESVDPATSDAGTVGVAMTAFHTDAVDMRFVAGRFQGRGPSTVWMRLRCPVVSGEEPSPLQRVAAVADFGNGISSVLPWEQWLFINPDLTVSVHRLPRGEWVGLDAVTRLGALGVGQAESVLFDEEGVLGRAVQSLIIEPTRRDG